MSTPRADCGRVSAKQRLALAGSAPFRLSHQIGRILVLLALLGVGCTSTCPSGTTTQTGDVCKRQDSDSAGPQGSGAPAVGPRAGVAGSVVITGANAGSDAHVGGLAGSVSTMPTTPACSTEEITRCAPKGVGARELCQSGAWVPGSSCGSGQTCVMSGDQAMCMPLNALCSGGSNMVCDAQGGMLRCNADGTASMLATCSDATLCMAGLPSGKCASCAPESHRCKGSLLQTCAADGQTFMSTDCITPELCNASLGMCKPATCTAGEAMCDGDALKQCDPSQTSWMTLSQCPPGMCDEANKACRVCTPDQRRCSGDSLMICDAKGQKFTSTACTSSKPHCIDDGNCVACTKDADCATPDQCMTSKCANNECVVSTAPDFTKCSTSGNGMCSEGECQPLVAIRSAITENAETPYIQASTANLQLAANGRSIGPFETFLQCRVSGSSYAFRSYETKRFVTVHADGYVYADGGSTLRTATTFQVSGSNIRLTDGSGAYLECQPLNSGNEHAGKLERQSTPHAPTFWEDLPIDPGTWTVP